MNIIENVKQIRILDGRIQYISSGNVWKNFPYVFNTNSDELSSDIITALYTGDINIDLITNLIDWSAAKHFTLELTDDTELFDVNLPESPLIKEILLTVVPDDNNLTLPTYWRVISGTYDDSVDNFIRINCITNASQAKVDTVTLSGTTGTADMTTVGGLTKEITFVEDLETTASNFVTDYAADYLAVKIIVTSDGADIIFTSQYAGYNFSSPVVNNASDDLAGVVVNTTANISPLVWCSISQVAA
jgi:hypothetical protein